MARRPDLLLVDLSYETYRASAAHPLLTHEGKFTGGLYGFLVSVARQVRDAGARRAVLCCDRKPYRRSLAYPDYKLLRKKNQDDELLLAQRESLGYALEMLPALGVPAWGIDGFESDDLVAHVVAQHRHRYSRIYAASNDSDLCQLFWCERFVLVRGSMKKAMDARVFAEQGLTPEQFVQMSALMGTHNDIAGVPGVGPATAAKAVRDPALWRTYRADHAALIDRNVALIRLPHPEFPAGAPVPGRSARFSARELYRWCSRFGISATKPMLDAFEQLDNEED